MRRLSALLTVAACGGLPSSLSAQDGIDACEVEESRSLNAIGRGTPYQVVFLGGPVIRCTGGLRITADSAVMTEQTKITEFIGRVDYQDTAKALTTDYAQYHGRERRLIAQGNVVLTDVQTGSVITAPFLDYYQASDTRPDELVLISAGRPRAVMIRTPAADSLARDTTVIDADAMEIHGQTRFVGRGNVEITRAGTKAYAGSSEFVQGGGTMRLIGEARIESDSLRMAGDSIVGETTDDEEFRELRAWGRAATLDGEAVDIEAPWIRILLVDGVVDRLIAAVPGAAPAAAVLAAADTLPPDTVAVAPDTLGLAADSLALATDSLGADSLGLEPERVPLPVPTGAPGAAEGPRARAVSADFRLLGDSIDALAPGRVLERVVAVGHAFGERLLPDDTLSAGLPEVARRDWLEGAVIRATFTEAPEMRPDTAADRVLESVTAIGEPARSIYRRIDPADPGTGYSISYLLARRIRIELAEGEVQDVEAESAQGLYLQPRVAGAVGTGGTPVVRR
jgi:lipopolysaccharide export system protein LptA